MEIEKIDDMPMREPVGEVAHDPATEQAEADLYGQKPQAERAPPEEDRRQSHQREQGEQGAFAGEEAPRRAGVTHMHDIEEARDDFDVPRRSISAERQATVDPKLRQL